MDKIAIEGKKDKVIEVPLAKLSEMTPAAGDVERELEIGNGN